jgi:DNA-binding SARP family transcriptional activator
VLEFRILGPLEVSRDGEQLQLSGQKQRALLALLLFEANRVVSQLRKLLGTETLVTKPPGYQLRLEPDQLDLERFGRLVEEARGEPPEARAAKLDQALVLWRGPPLADLGFESFAQSEIGRLEELRLAVIEDKIEAELEAGRHAEIVGELEALADENPLRERLRGQLMLALYRSGRQAEALQIYHDTRRVLVDELGIDPSPSLQQLHGAILRQDPTLETGTPAPQAPADRLDDVFETLLAGRLVPVLGADVGELTTRLAERFEYPANGDALPRVAQYIAVMKGSGPLYDELHALLETDLPPTPIHCFFAALPPLLRERGVPHQLIVTTSYDLALERAFLAAGEEFDVVSYLAAGRNRGKFCHLAPDGSGTLIEVPNTYATELSLERRTIILKLHGQVGRSPDDREWESFVVTEDDYIEYLAQSEVANVVPVALGAKLRRSHFLFLGYTMADWNLRLLLHRLWGDQPLSYRSWAVQPEPMPLEREFWRRRDVDVLEIPLERYIEALARHAGLELAGASA